MSVIQFELLPPFFGNNKVLKGNGIPLVPDIEKLIKFSQGDLGIADKIQKQSLIRGLTKTEAYMTPEILNVYLQACGGELTKNPKEYIKDGKLNITPDDIIFKSSNIGLVALEKTVFQSIFENMGPYSKMILTISELLPDIEDVIARVLALPCLPIISLKSMKPVTNPLALGYKKDEIRKLQRQMSSMIKKISESDTTTSDVDITKGLDIMNQESKISVSESSSNTNSDYDWEIVSTEYSTGVFIPSIKYQIIYRDILIPNDTNIDSGDGDIEDDEDLRPNSIIFDVKKIKGVKSGNSVIKNKVIKLKESQLPDWILKYKWKGNWEKINYSSGSISKYKNVYTKFTSNQGLRDFPEDKIKQKEALDIVSKVEYDKVVEAGTKGITFWTGRKIWENLRRVKEFKTTTPSSFDNMIINGNYKLGSDSNKEINLLNKKGTMFLPKIINVKNKRGENEEVVVDPEDYNLQWIKLIRKRRTNSSVNTNKPLAINYQGYNVADILNSGEYIRSGDKTSNIFTLSVPNDSYEIDDILKRGKGGKYISYKNLNLIDKGEWDARTNIVKVPNTETTIDINDSPIGSYYKVSYSGRTELFSDKENSAFIGTTIKSWNKGDIVIRTRTGWIKLRDNSDFRDRTETTGSDIIIEEVSITGKRKRTYFTETLYVLEGVKKTLKQEGVGTSNNKKNGSGKGGGYYKTPDFFGSIPGFLKVIIKIATKLLPQIQDVLKLISNPFKIIMDQIFGKLEVNFDNFSSDFLGRFSQISNITDKYKRKLIIENDPLLSKYVSVDEDYNYKFVFDGFAIIDLFGFGFGIDLKNFVPKLNLTSAKGSNGQSIKSDTNTPINNRSSDSINGSQVEDVNCLTNDEKKIKDTKINELINKASELINLANIDFNLPDLNLGTDALIKMKLAQIFDPNNIPLGESAQELKNKLNINTQPLIDFLIGLVSMPLKIVVGIVNYILDFFKSLTNPMTLAPKLIEFLSFKWFLDFFKPSTILELIGIKINPKLMTEFLNDAKNSKDLTKKYNLSEVFSVPFMPKLPVVNKEELETLKDKPLQMITSFLYLIEEIINSIICFLWDLLNLDLLLGPCIKVKFSDIVLQNLSNSEMNEALNGAFNKYVQNASLDPSERTPLSDTDLDSNFVYEYTIRTPDGEVIVKGLDYTSLNDFRKENPFYTYNYNF